MMEKYNSAGPHGLDDGGRHGNGCADNDLQ